MKTLIVTGAAGFIGSHFCRLALNKGYEVYGVDSLTYASDLTRIGDLWSNNKFKFYGIDIESCSKKDSLFKEADAIVHFAAETHVDNSINDHTPFLSTNINGTVALLEAATKHNLRLVLVSTDEVYGSISHGFANENYPYNPRSPYSASKASAEMMANAWLNTFNTDVVITRGSNTFGPGQHIEKFIPKIITNALNNESIPIYGNGQQIRDWIYVEDHCSGIMKVLESGVKGQSYNIAGECEKTNSSIANIILNLMNNLSSFITHVEDRKGHDFRYAMNCDKLKNLGWSCKTDFYSGLEETIKYYKEKPSDN